MKRIILIVLFSIVCMSSFAAGTTDTDNGGAKKYNYTLVESHLGASQVIPSAAETNINWAGGEIVDSKNELLNDTFTPKTTAYYSIDLCASLASCTSTMTTFMIISEDGSNIPYEYRYFTNGNSFAIANGPGMLAHWDIKFTAGKAYVFKIYHDGGNNILLRVGNTRLIIRQEDPI